ncbi:MAG: imidazole glycerol phosphate synthase subunit HisH [Gemmatimonadaceae bacterium]|nr:imidazole glycerol phosphate synthase subunit HisH [Gemmatimonadaceae bacterium]
MRVSVFDYGAGNLHSLVKALAHDGAHVEIETSAARAARADVLVLPGVGAFGHAAERMSDGLADMRSALRDGLPCLGICLGMQLLFDGSDEGDGEGLGIFPGRVKRLEGGRVPQIGWNTIEAGDDRLLDAAPLSTAYYANSYICQPDDLSCVRAWSTHGATRFPALVRAGRTVGVQFHPEKSSAAGVELVRTFLRQATQ